MLFNHEGHEEHEEGKDEFFELIYFVFFVLFVVKQTLTNCKGLTSKYGLILSIFCSPKQETDVLYYEGEEKEDRLISSSWIFVKSFVELRVNQAVQSL